MSKYEKAMEYAGRLQILATSHDFEVSEFSQLMADFADASAETWPDVPFEVVADALANFGPDGVRGAVAKYRIDQYEHSRLS